MSLDRERYAGPTDQPVVNDYDSFAEANESSLITGYYVRPAILDQAGDVAGRRILDVGCGAGPLLAVRRDRDRRRAQREDAGAGPAAARRG